VPIPEQDRELHDRLAVALLRRVEATLHLAYMPPEVVTEPLLVDGRLVIGGRQFDSLDLIEALVALEQDLGVLILDRVELARAATLEGIARLFIAKADRAAVERFCGRWEAAGQYRP
jgi:hypothetical protein